MTDDSTDGARPPRVTQPLASRDAGSVTHRRTVPGEARARGRGRFARLVRAVTAAALAPAAAATLAAPAVAAPGTATGGKGLRWEACAGVSTPELRCARVTVPLDHSRPRGRTISVVISRLPATDPARRRGVLLTTGGGPGGPGVPLPASLAPALSAEVRARYDLVGFDMRFVERSTPIGCGQPEEEPGGFWVRPATPGRFPAEAAEARRYAEDCVRASGWALPHATTANAARDMDLIRAALGEEKISYLGGSYAGLLGTVYGTLFPHRVDRFVLDSPVNADTIWRPYEMARTPAFERGTVALAAWAAARHAEYGLGETTAEVHATLTGILDRAARAPVVIGAHAWTVGELGALLVAGIYDERAFGVVAAAFAAVAAGREPFLPFPIRPPQPEGVPGVPADHHTATNIAYRCADAPWPRDPRVYLRDIAAERDHHPLFGPGNANINPCAFWPPAKDETVRLDGNRAPAALVVAALRDVAVPLSVSRAVAARIRGSRLVTIDAHTHAPFPHYGNACLNETVTRYLTTGELPATDTACSTGNG
ncbi:alpha/beta fold hydrolase [Herbidospora sp. NBRC 101105]|uniref:alpha/beta fold hydrolase n=1 Tax=Herbidospora sp. NBRC 101105 TaxID=3032195 RepID=UPI0024A36DD8|nr:alpha/beta fold hydrolase [Herbidospora sp. NBRC 101105]GLX94552.1 alpha/beta hydrolase [Herbidospora sp. NBRC 101105]